ncbi:AAA family ATPase [bacterium]|nr:AAA family ATPase [bacterium]
MQFYIDSKSHREASVVLDTCIQQGEGFIKIVGDIGTGKTMMCRRLLSMLPEYYLAIHIPNPYLSAEGLYCAIAHELGIAHTASNAHILLRRIEEELVQLTILGRKAILVVDEAQSMPEETLEALRLITNLETEKAKLLQVVLFAQKELDEILKSPRHRQFLQRITFSYQLKPLTLAQTRDYICHRLSTAGAGAQANHVFSDRAVKTAYQSSNGTPRLINILCHKAMLSALGRGASLVDKQDVIAAVLDTEGVQKSRWSARWLLPWAATLAGLIVTLSDAIFQAQRLLG